MNTAINTAVGTANTDTRTLRQTRVRTAIISRRFTPMALLLAAIFISALAVVYVQAMNRILYSDFQSLQKTRDSLGVEWSQLLLEQNTWGTQARVQEIANRDLQMVVPDQKDVVIVTN